MLDTSLFGAPGAAAMPGGTGGSTLTRCIACGHEERKAIGQKCSLCGTTLFDIAPDAGAVPAPALAVHRVLAHYLNRCGIRFVYAGNPLTPEQLLQPEGLLPVIAIEAMRLWQTLEHRPGTAPADRDTLQVTFSNTQEGAFFPLAAYPPAIGPDPTSTLRLLVFVLAMRRVLGLKEGETIDLKEYIAQWDRLDWTGEALPDMPIPKGYDLQYALREFIPGEALADAHVDAGGHATPGVEAAAIGGLPAQASVGNPFASQGGGS